MLHCCTLALPHSATLTLLGSKYTCEMGKNKQKKQNNAPAPPQTPATDNTKAVKVEVEAEPNGKSDIDKVLDDWLNSCDDEIPDESNLVKADETQGSKKAHKEGGKKDEDKKTVPDDSQPQPTSVSSKVVPEPSVSQEPKSSTEATDAWIDDDNVGFSMKDEDDAVIVTKMEKQIKEQKKEEVKKNTEKPKVSSPKPEPKSDIDSILDDWLNGGDDDDVPDELPEIDDVKKDKKTVKDMKTQKKNDILADMSKLSNIMDEKTDKKVQNNVESFFAGSSNKLETEPKKVVPQPQPTKEPAPAETKKAEAKKAAVVPVGDCVVCGRLAKLLCSVCKNVFYCNRECQKKHWATHKEECKTLAKLPYRVSTLTL